MGAGHWTRSLLLSPNRAEARRRSGIPYQYRRQRHGGGGRPGGYLRAGSCERREFGSSPPACAMRSAWRGSLTTGILWTVVNERDGFGRRDTARLSDLGARWWLLWLALLLLGADRGRPREAGFAPWSQRPSRPITHWAGILRRWDFAGCPRVPFPVFRTAWPIGQHGSWNCSTLSGYKLVYVPFVNGQPAGPPRDILFGLPCTRREGVLWQAGWGDA